MNPATDRPLTILVAAMGGEGGGGVSPLGSEGGRLLLKWLSLAASRADLPLQSTLLPGTTQRTGSTTYYIEVFPKTFAQLGEKRPILRLSPRPGDVDLVVAYELVEAARAVQNGYVTPDRTTLIASSHRSYTIIEKIAMTDGRIDSAKILSAARERAKAMLLFDMGMVSRETETTQHAVVLGAIAATGCLPLSIDACRDAIRALGVNVASNLNAYEAGLARASNAARSSTAEPAAANPRRRRARDKLSNLMAATEREFDGDLLTVVSEGVKRVADYQDIKAAEDYLDKVRHLHGLEGHNDEDADGNALTREAARHLALWSTYEDVIRVAELKTRKDRFERIRAETGAKAGDVVDIVEFLKPGIEELATVLPKTVGHRVVNWAYARGYENKFNIGLYVKSTSLFGFLLLNAVAALKPVRRFGYRYHEEHALIAVWWQAVETAARTGKHALAREIAETARMVKGYSDTRRRGIANFRTIFDGLVQPALTLAGPGTEAARQVRLARDAALSDPDGNALEKTLRELAGTDQRATAE